MKKTNKQIFRGVLLGILCFGSSAIHADDLSDLFVRRGPEKQVAHKKAEKQDTQKKEKIKITRGDCSLTIGGEAKIEHYLHKNLALLNSQLPDEAEYFKNTLDLNFDFVYGEKKFGHKAVEFYGNLRHKGVWGRGAVFADSDSVSSSEISLSDSVFGKHSHTNGKPLVWFSEAWLQFSINAIVGASSQKVHYLKLGWIPFSLGRGIALGSYYGLNRELLGLYSYSEDKGSPGINLHGELIKDRLTYDVFYGKFEERGKSLRDTLNGIKERISGSKTAPWRGVAKDDEVIAARVNWKALNEHRFGTLELEPYVYYNEASDQKVEIAADTKTELGAIGLALEHKYKGFEFGGEVAGNFGSENLRAIDRNRIIVHRNENGQLEEVYSHLVEYDNSASNNRKTVVDASGATVNKLVPVDQYTTKAAQATVASDSEQITISGASTSYISVKDRFRPAYKNKLRGWMIVLDAAYTFDKPNLTLAAAYGYASGDKNPHVKETSKTYKGFIGLHEGYKGKRVKSVLLLDERLIKIPSPLGTGDTSVAQDFAFSDLHHFGFSLDWKPTWKKSREITINPNVVFFWRDVASKKWDVTAGKASDEDASKFMGTEVNLLTKTELLDDLHVFANFGIFVPGQYFEDLEGIPLDGSFFDIASPAIETDLIKQKYSLSHDTAYYLNVGFEYKF